MPQKVAPRLSRVVKLSLQPSVTPFYHPNGLGVRLDLLFGVRTFEGSHETYVYAGK